MQLSLFIQEAHKIHRISKSSNKLEITMHFLHANTSFLENKTYLKKCDVFRRINYRFSNDINSFSIVLMLLQKKLILLLI